MCQKVWAENYEEAKAKHEKMMAGMPKEMKAMMGDMDIVPVDLNHAFVAVDKAKEDNIDHAAHMDRERFGLLKPGEEV